jgi:AAA domain
MSNLPVTVPEPIATSSPAGRPAPDNRRPLPDMLRLSARLLSRPSQIAGSASPVEWLWDGYLARKHLTLLTVQWKIGKTTLLSALLARLGEGGELAGRRVHPGRAVIFTEEDRSLWQRRITRHHIGEWVSFSFNSFTFRPLPDEWDKLIDDLLYVHRTCGGIDLVAFDSLASVLQGHEEADSAAMIDLLRTLRLVACEGPAILLPHHPRKGPSLGGSASRGTGALPASVDCLMEMHWSGCADRENRRRRLQAWSHWEETPRRVLLELSECGTDYRLLPDEPDAAGTGAWPTLEGLLRAAPNLTIQEIYERWPAGVERPGFRALSVWLRELSDSGRLERSGHGHRYAPFRYRVLDEGPAAAGEPAASAAG